MPNIPSPYYFVPLSDQVYQPSWAEQASHDLPFRDGLSGELTIEIEAKRPIYVRGQAEKPESNDPNERGYLQCFHHTSNVTPSSDEQAAFDAWTSFSKLGEHFAIPPTSIKGVIRNVVKVAGFGSFWEASETERYSVRDLSPNSPYQRRFVGGSPRYGITFEPNAGWLKRDGDDWKIFPCSHYHRVEQDDLCRAFGGITRQNFVDTEQSSNSVAAKYTLWVNAGHPLEILFQADSERDWRSRHPPKGKRKFPLPLKYRWATKIGSGKDVGTLVLTGQPSDQKHMEFLFEPANLCEGRPNPICLVDDQIKEFLFIHEDHESEAWKYWRPKFEAGHAVPVFWLKPKNGETSKNGLKAFGLAQLFRFPSDRTLRDGIPSDHFAGKHDLADLIFGTLQGDPLRGRASFAHFVAEGDPTPMDTVWTVLGSPKPTFHPNYLEQECDPDQPGILVHTIEGERKKWRPYRTFMSEQSEFRLRGWKRYAVRRDWRGENNDRVLPERHDFTHREPPSFDAATAFAPLPAGTRFKGNLRFHNLRPAELGALIWAIEWGGKSDLCHLVGMAKGMGMGSVTMWIPDRESQSFQKADGSGVVSLENSLEEFRKAMKDEFREDWEQSDQIRELTLLADPSAAPNETELGYPILEVGGAGGNTNQFAEAKRANIVLRSYGEVTGRHARTPWDPAESPAPQISPKPKVVDATQVTVEITGSDKKRRAKDRVDGFSGIIANLADHPEVEAGQVWNAERSGPTSSPVFTLCSVVAET